MTPRSWRVRRAEVEARLAGAGVEAVGAEARWLIEEASGYEGAELLAVLDDAAPDLAAAALDAMVDRRLAGEPIQYVLGHWPFRALDLLVDRRVLIPRPETEQVVERALIELAAVTPAGARATVADLGSGSGAIGLSIAAERPGTDVWLVEQSPDALAVTRANLAGLGMAGARVRVAEGSWFDALPDACQRRFDLVVANPPYVAEVEPLPASVRDWEPAAALVAGPTGREAIEAILADVAAWSVPGGAVVLEIGADQGPAAVAMARAAGLLDPTVHPDLAGRDRTLVAHAPR